MKTFIKKLIHLLYSLAFLFAGFVILDSYFQYIFTFQAVNQKVQFLFSDKFALFLTGSTLMLIPILHFIVNLFSIRKESFLKYNTDEGEILISIHAVEDFIKRVSRNFREIKDAYPLITLKGKGAIEVSLRLKLWSGIQNLPSTLEEIQKEVRNQIHSMIGIENITRINIFLAKDSFAHRDIVPPKSSRQNYDSSEKKQTVMPPVYVPKPQEQDETKSQFEKPADNNEF